MSGNKFVSAKEMIDLGITEIPMLVSPIFPKVGIAILAGSSDSGKSTILRQLAVSVCLGLDNFLGFNLNAEHKRAIYVSTEDDELATSYLLMKYGFPPAEQDKLVNLKYIFDSDSLLKDLDEELTQSPADLIIIDTFTDIYEDDMNMTNKIRSFINKFREVVNKHKCLLILLHHTRKGAEQSTPSKNSLLGSQGLEAKARSVVLLFRDTQDIDKRHLCIVKGNYISDTLKTHSYVIKFNPDTLSFVPTDERVVMSSIRNPPNYSDQDREEKVARAQELQDEGLSITDIHSKMIEEGYKISRSSVGYYVK